MSAICELSEAKTVVYPTKEDKIDDCYSLIDYTVGARDSKGEWRKGVKWFNNRKSAVEFWKLNPEFTLYAYVVYDGSLESWDDGSDDTVEVAYLPWEDVGCGEWWFNDSVKFKRISVDEVWY